MNQLSKLNQAKQALEEAKSIQEILDVRVIGEAIKYYASKKKLSLEIQNDANIFLVDAEIKLGESLSAMEKNKGEAGQFTGGNKNEPPVKKPLKRTLSEIGVTKKESSESQLLAKNQDKVKKIIEKKIEKKEPISKTKIISELKPVRKIKNSLRKEYNIFSDLVLKQYKILVRASLTENYENKGVEFSRFMGNDLEKFIKLIQSWKTPEKVCKICDGKVKYICSGTPLHCDQCDNGKLGDRL